MNTNRPELAVATFKQGYSCAQSVLSAYADELGLERDLAMKVSCGFGGGMGRTAGTCGAVTGAIMVLGLKHGITVGDKPRRQEVYRRVRAYMEQFQAKHGHLNCRDLLGVDMSTEEGFKQVAERQLTATLCPNFVRTAAELLEESL